MDLVRRTFLGQMPLTFAGLAAKNPTNPLLAYSPTHEQLYASALSFYNVKDYGAVGNGLNDDTSAIQATINAANATKGGIVFFPPGTYAVSSTLTLNTSNVVIAGTGPGSLIQPTANFSGLSIIAITADLCGVHDLQIAYANPSSSSNPSADGIQLIGARHITLKDLQLCYLNGWAIESIGASGTPCVGAIIQNIRIFHCTNGIHTLGVAGSNYSVQHYISDINAEIIDSGDALFLEDSMDAWIVNYNGAMAGTSSTGSMLHIKGRCSSILCTNFTIGCMSTPSANTVLIENGANGSPSGIVLSNGAIQAGIAGIEIDGGTKIHVSQCIISANSTYGVNITGSASSILIDGCSFASNGQAGSSGRYDVQVASSGHVRITNNCFTTQQGSNPGQTNNALSYTSSGHCYVLQNYFEGTGYNSTNIFNGTPTVVQNNTNYNPLGNIPAPSITSSPCTPPAQNVDAIVYITGGNVSKIAIDGADTGLTSGTFRVPATKRITLTYSSKPQWTWFGE